jgi:FkbM family methyltransferase
MSMKIRTAQEWALHSLDFIREFLATKSSNRFVLGINSWSESIAEKIPIAAFIDDFTDQRTHQGLPVVRSSEITQDSLVINASTVRTWDSHMKLNTLEVRHLDYYSFQRYSDLNLLEIRDMPWDLWLLEVSVNSKEYNQLSSLLYDFESKSTLNSILDFREDCQVAKLSRFKFLPDDQYFDFFSDLEHEIFFDVGGYDGMTTRIFANTCPSYKAIKVFEPDKLNAQSITQNLKHLRNLEVLNIALSDKRGMVGFASGRGSASFLDTNSSNFVMAELGDSFSNPPPTFIKMDIEGGEESALTGFSNTIKNSRPRMAIAAYHKPSDLWRLTKLVKTLNPNYRVALRHYTQGQMESVLYFF